MNLWAMPTEIYSQALRAWWLRPFYSEAPSAPSRSLFRSPQGFTLRYSERSSEIAPSTHHTRAPPHSAARKEKEKPSAFQPALFPEARRASPSIPPSAARRERKALIALSRPHPRSPQGFTFDTSERSSEERKGLQSEKRYSTGILYTYLYFIFCSITNITGTMMRVRKNEKTTP